MTEDVATSVRPIAELFRGDCVALWATTYNVQLSLFNDYLLRRLGDAPLNAVVLADRRSLDEALAAIPAERLDSVGAVNRRWLLRSMQAGTGRFHPKSYLAVRARSATLMVGSGNLSANGIDKGREVFTTFTTDNPVGEAAIGTWRAWMQRLVGASSDTLLAERFADLEQRLPKLDAPVAVVDSPLWHNLDSPLGPRFCDAVSITDVDEIIATAPFFDEEGEALGYVVDRLRPKFVRLYMTSSTSVAGPALLRRLRATGCELELFAYEPDRFTHAKLLAAVAGDRGWIMSGSANLSRAALTLPPGPANVELAVFSQLHADDVRATFLPPDVSASPMALTELEQLTYDTNDTTDALLPIRLERATITRDGRVQVTAQPAPPSDALLADHRQRSIIDVEPSIPVSHSALEGPLVRVEGLDGTPLSNWAVLEDTEALARALALTSAGASSRPTELTGADLDTPLGRALLYLHRNLVMDATEIPTASAGGSNGVASDEADANEADDLWDRLERETLARDPRAGNYARHLESRTRTDSLTSPIGELLDAMRNRAPGSATDSTARSVLARLVQEHRDTGARAKVTWSTDARIRVRTRNVLRRWAASQTDPRLAWVHPLAPLVNLGAVATAFIDLQLYAVDPNQTSELDRDDLDDLWARWLQPIIGTGHRDGWLDRAGVSDDDLANSLGDDFVEMCSALCWLAIRSGTGRRERLVAWQPTIRVALDRGLIDDSQTTAEYLSIIEGRDVPRTQLTEDFLYAIEFMDDRLWCEQIARQLELDALELESAAAGSASVKLLVRGVDDPLHDPRLARLVVAARTYRKVDAVAVYATDIDWRIVMEPGEPAYFLPMLGGEPRESTPLRLDDLDRVAAGHGVLADLFPRVADVA